MPSDLRFAFPLPEGSAGGCGKEGKRRMGWLLAFKCRISPRVGPGSRMADWEMLAATSGHADRD